MAINKYTPISNCLNVNSLNTPIKRHRGTEWMKKITHTHAHKTHLHAACKRLTADAKIQIESEGIKKDILCKCTHTHKSRVAIIISVKMRL